jgi:ribosomal-protein-alanine N-acetyltransferase
MHDSHSPVAAPPVDGLPVIGTPRLRLRGHRESDLQAYFDLHADPAVMRYWSWPAWTSIEQAREKLVQVIGHRSAQQALCWAVADRDDDRLIGSVVLFAINREQGRAEIGYALAASHWGRGLAQEAMAAVLRHAFDTLGLRRIEADIDPRNAGSCRLVERMGFTREGLLRERWCVADEVSDSAIYGLLAADWLALDRGR